MKSQLTKGIWTREYYNDSHLWKRSLLCEEVKFKLNFDKLLMIKSKNLKERGVNRKGRVLQEITYTILYQEMFRALEQLKKGLLI